jgi:integrase
MAQFSVIKDAADAARKEASAFEASAPKACTWEQMKEAVQKADQMTKEKLVLAWLTCGRVGDVTQLKWEHVSLKETGEMTVLFRRGKTAGATPHTVPTKCPPQWLPILQNLLGTRKKGQFLWHAATPQARTDMGRQVAAALKTVDRGLEQRSIRRGALQKMAEENIPDETLLLFSGHKRMETLRRYLDWGRKGSERTRRGQAAAAHLVGGQI